MSTYYSFYILEKKSRYYDYVGGYYPPTSDETAWRGIPLTIRSRSFINQSIVNDWDKMPVDQLSKQAQKAIFGDSIIDSQWLNLKVIPFTTDIFRENFESLLTRGYVNLTEWEVIASNNYDLDYLRYEADIKNAEFVAALPNEYRKEYVPISFVNPCSDAYIYEEIRRSADMLNIWPEKAGYYILCVIA